MKIGKLSQSPLSTSQRVLTHVTELIVELVESGQISEEQLDVSVRRILRDKYRLGLFDNPYVDEKRSLVIF